MTVKSRSNCCQVIFGGSPENCAASALRLERLQWSVGHVMQSIWQLSVLQSWNQLVCVQQKYHNPSFAELHLVLSRCCPKFSFQLFCGYLSQVFASALAGASNSALLVGKICEFWDSNFELNHMMGVFLFTQSRGKLPPGMFANPSNAKSTPCLFANKSQKPCRQVVACWLMCCHLPRSVQYKVPRPSFGTEKLAQTKIWYTKKNRAHNLHKKKIEHLFFMHLIFLFCWVWCTCDSFHLIWCDWGMMLIKRVGFVHVCSLPHSICLANKSAEQPGHRSWQKEAWYVWYVYTHVISCSYMPGIKWGVVAPEQVQSGLCNIFFKKDCAIKISLLWLYEVFMTSECSLFAVAVIPKVWHMHAMNLCCAAHACSCMDSGWLRLFVLCTDGALWSGCIVGYCMGQWWGHQSHGPYTCYRASIQQ